MSTDPENTNEGVAEGEVKTISEDMFEHMVPLNVKGTVTPTSLKDVIAKAQKADAVEMGFQQLHDEKKDFQTALDVYDDLKKGFLNQDEESIKRAFRNTGLSDEQVNALFNRATLPAGQEDENTGDEGAGEAENSAQNQRLERVEAALETLGTEREQTLARGKETRFKEDVNQGLDNNNEMASLLKKSDPDTQVWIRDQVYAEVVKASRSIPWGPRAIALGIENAKNKLDKVGAFRSSQSDEDEDNSDAGYNVGAPPPSSSVGRLHQNSDSKRPAIFSKEYLPWLAKEMKRKPQSSRG